MKELGYYNGRIGELSEMTVPMSDRACWFGDGVYDAQMCRNGWLFTLQEHVDRFFRSAAMAEIPMPLEKEALKALLQRLVGMMDTGDLFVYYQVTRGSGPRKHDFPAGAANLWVTMTPRKVKDGGTIALITHPDTRYLHCNVKTLNLLPSVIAAQRAKEAGAYESVLYRPGDRVTECAHSNVSVLRDGVLWTAPTDNLILPGISRAHLIAAAGRLGIPVREEPFTLDFLRGADEIITTSSSALCLRADTLDGQPAGMRDPERWEALHGAVLGEYYDETA